jgi:transcriptional regulator with XRE-family HTH domain
LSTIEKIANALGVDPLELFQAKGKPPPMEETQIQDKKKAILLLIERELDKILRNK